MSEVNKETQNSNAAPPSGEAKPTIDLNTPHTQTINGKEVTKPLKEWLTGASKWDGLEGEKLVGRVGELSKLEQALQTAINPNADIDQRIEAQRLIYTRAGLDATTREQRLNELRTALSNPDGGANEEEEVSETENSALKQTIQQLQGDAERLKKRDAERAAEEFSRKIQDYLNNDKDLSVYYKHKEEQGGPEALKAFKAELFKEAEESAYEALERRAGAGETFKLSWLNEAIPDAKRRALSLAGNMVGAPSSLGRAAGVDPELDFGFTVPEAISNWPDATADEQKKKDALQGEFLRMMAEQMRGASGTVV